MACAILSLMVSKPRRAWVRLALIGALGVLSGSACLSPTLPLPPPEKPDVIENDASTGFWTISGDCNAGAIVMVFNENTGEGAVIEDRDGNGRYKVTIKGDLCDMGWVKQESGLDTSSRTTFTIEERTSAGPVDPAACP